MSAYTVTSATATSHIARRHDAIRRARDLAQRDNAGDVKVTDAEGLLVFSCNKASLEGRLFNAWERIEKGIRFAVADIEGYVPGYVRKTAQAVVFRPLTKGNPWIVVSPAGREIAANTKAACAITNRLVAEAKSQRIVAREAAKEAKKVAREARLVAVAA